MLFTGSLLFCLWILNTPTLADKKFFKVLHVQKVNKSRSNLESKISKYNYIGNSSKKLIIESIKEASLEHSIPEALIFELIKKESSFRNDIVSPAGAVGLTQLIPSTAKSYCGLSYGQLFEIKKNIKCGAKYLRIQMDEFGGDISYALAAYNAGPGRLKKIYSKDTKISYKKVARYLPSETRNYVAGITKHYTDFV
jgi:soluble lytic murein transglycosylase-like protein